MRLLPREEKFFHYFKDQARIIAEAAGLLLQGARAGNAELAEAVSKIKKLEQAGDEIIHEIFTRLNQTFITPIDPEDIHSLSSFLDDVLDSIEETAHRMSAYHLESIPPAVVKMCEIVRSCPREERPRPRPLHRNQPPGGIGRPDRTRRRRRTLPERDQPDRSAEAERDL